MMMMMIKKKKRLLLPLTFVMYFQSEKADSKDLINKSVCEDKENQLENHLENQLETGD
jgi:hypothetical protein